MPKGLALSRVLTNDASAVVLSDADLALLTAAAPSVVRLEFRLGSAHLTWDDGLIGLYRQALVQLQTVCPRIIGLLDPALVAYTTQADWNANNTENNPGVTPTNPFVDKYLLAVGRIMSSLGDLIETWEIWNEANSWTQHSGTVYSGGTYLYPSIYVTLLDRVFALRDGLLPSATLSTGGLLAHSIGGVYSFTNSGAGYLTSLLEEIGTRGGISRPFDSVGLHLYLDQGSLTSTYRLAQYLGYYTTTLSRYGLAGTPLLVTEAGWSTRNVAPDVQATNLQFLYAACAGEPSVADVCWFLPHDVGTLLFGLAGGEPTLTPKPALAAYQGIA